MHRRWWHGGYYGTQAVVIGVGGEMLDLCGALVLGMIEELIGAPLSGFYSR